ncbi:hypothetical protein [Janthinobacterium sp. LB2P70]|uniref:hypothetical protein n=1 Tax=Janthinobacterium sp. LB2P70 TaxID=3424197 RepID=UPI003F24CC92
MKFKKIIKKKVEPGNWFSKLTLAAQSYTSIVSVLGGVSIYIGWTYCNSYFSTMDASWVVSSIGVITMIKMSAQVIVPILMILLVLYTFMAHSNDKRKVLFKIDKYSVICLLLWIFIFSILVFVFDRDLGFIFQYGISFFIYVVSSSAILGLMVDVGSKDYSWEKLRENLVNGVLMLVFLVGPSYQASLKARSDMDIVESALPVVKSELLPKDIKWRLLTTLDSTYVLVALAQHPKDRIFRVLNVKEPLTINSAGK